ncbi:HNH endonuclease [Gordonia terrae]|uniref:HNH endonuclease n=1 Tax=Gordonia terrae TaxID=2055 RepID=UPI003CC809D1
MACTSVTADGRDRKRPVHQAPATAGQSPRRKVPANGHRSAEPQRGRVPGRRSTQRSRRAHLWGSLVTASKRRPRGQTHTLKRLQGILLRRLQARGPIVCHLCGQVIRTTAEGGDRLEWDHLIPVTVDPSRAESITNLAPSHRRCNQARGDMGMSEWWAATGAGKASSRRWI